MTGKVETLAGEHSDALSIEERRDLIERVAASQHFRRSARLRDFLLYVGRQSLKEGCPEIHEQDIGAKVFGRPPNYDRSQDNIVRVNATDLRKRIDAYFGGEGADEPLIFEIPRGGYRPVFSRRPAASVTNAPQSLPLRPVAAASPPHLSVLQVALIAAVAALSVLSAVLFIQLRGARKIPAPWADKPATAALWTPFVQSAQETDVVLADASVSLGQDIDNQPMSLSDYMDHRYLQRVESLALSADRREDLEQVFQHNLVAFGDVDAAEQILSLLPRPSRLHLTLSRYFPADSLKRNSYILIGGKKANPWVQLFDQQMNFSLDFGHKAFITNRHPRPGEQAEYSYPTGSQTSLMGYSVIAFLPNPARTGNVIILAGTDSDATSAAAEFITSEQQLSSLRQRLGVERFPYFEVLLKTSRLNGTSLNAELIAYRTYGSPG